ncbi:hypothetical protein KIN20_016212 [Parelaphostrongylus tenuis]|uniref:Mitochondrial carrier protein n=1 Tax=Parelaphostrongylus tenuis TaxID=148309 RepID=A0AAD5MZI3_PARTN|nr:hypothetical protein KIN20_016212 [Parelaphostrongylus tenuis]
MFMDREALVHFIGGAVGGTAGTCVTCPLEVIKTRMQSSKGIISPIGPSTSQGGHSRRTPTPRPPTFRKPPPPPSQRSLFSSYKNILENTHRVGTEFAGSIATARGDISRSPPLSFIFSRFVQSQAREDMNTPRKRLNIIRYFSYIIKTEGLGALYKGLLPNLVGVAPSKAVYFYSYSTSKRIWNDSGLFVPNSAIIHMISAGSAGFVAASAVNPIWLVKTRLQLYHGKSTILQMIRRVYAREGIKGFYKGVTASYVGVSETVIQFVIYEHLRNILLRHHEDYEDKGKADFLNFMVAGGFAKFFACVITYPHEVVRTRLREESAVKRSFFSTLYDLYKEGGRSMYRGLSVQLMRTVPNTAITMGTYEVVVYMLHNFLLVPQ